MLHLLKPIRGKCFALACLVALLAGNAVFAQEEGEPVCPLHSSWDGSQCTCHAGYKSPKGRNDCVPISEVCNDFGPSHLVGDDCVCNEGYAIIDGGSKCESLSAECAKYDAIWNAAIQNCECPSGTHEDESAGKCVPDAAPEPPPSPPEPEPVPPPPEPEPEPAQDLPLIPADGIPVDEETVKEVFEEVQKQKDQPYENAGGVPIDEETAKEVFEEGQQNAEKPPFVPSGGIPVDQETVDRIMQKVEESKKKPFQSPNGLLIDTDTGLLREATDKEQELANQGISSQGDKEPPPPPEPETTVITSIIESPLERDVMDEALNEVLSSYKAVDPAAGQHFAHEIDSARRIIDTEVLTQFGDSGEVQLSVDMDQKMENLRKARVKQEYQKQVEEYQKIVESEPLKPGVTQKQLDALNWSINRKRMEIEWAKKEMGLQHMRIMEIMHADESCASCPFQYWGQPKEYKERFTTSVERDPKYGGLAGGLQQGVAFNDATANIKGAGDQLEEAKKALKNMEAEKRSLLNLPPKSDLEKVDTSILNWYQK